MGADVQEVSMAQKGFSDSNILTRFDHFRAWGSAASLDAYKSWREMFHLRPRVHFNGSYVSKVTYFRRGDPGLQRRCPFFECQIVYYRHLRFCSDGTVFMLTTTDSRQNTGHHMNNKVQTEVRQGRFRFENDDVVRISVQKQDEKRNRDSYVSSEYDFSRNSFKLQLQMTFSEEFRKPQLNWKKYSVRVSKFSILHWLVLISGCFQIIMDTSSTNDGSSSDFTLAADKYTPFVFSREKHYERNAQQSL